jgi:hypothetical protein
MGRRKKNVAEETPDDGRDPKENRKPSLKGDAKRSIAAVFCVTFAVLFMLGYFGGAGAFGDFLDSGMRSVFGWGKWIVPLLLFGLAIFFHEAGSRDDLGLGEVVWIRAPFPLNLGVLSSLFG